jgi:hypothetical protein
MNSAPLSSNENLMVSFFCPLKNRVNNLNKLPTVPGNSNQPASIEFLGGVLDTGTQKPAIRLSQAQAYCQQNNINLHLVHCNANYIFGDRICRSLGRFNIVVPTPSGTKMIGTHVVRANIPLLVGLDALDSHGWNVLTVENQLQVKREGWALPLTRKVLSLGV